MNHGLPGRLTSGGASAQEHPPFVTPSSRSSVTECQLMATLHLLQHGAPIASLSMQLQTDAPSADMAPQTPLTVPVTQTNNGCVGSMLKPSDNLAILSKKATWSHWTLAGVPSSPQWYITPGMTADRGQADPSSGLPAMQLPGAYPPHDRSLLPLPPTPSGELSLIHVLETDRLS